ncbi:alanine racemase [Acuticoccus sp. M5D2P5]|uniref:alanine racemase n=1 Tax=Acuticoccus kalidii TaxID=2910977 RepID=UPI001F2CB300|nr:alanine racemase [Acuticoccus kalidii]
MATSDFAETDFEGAPSRLAIDPQAVARNYKRLAALTKAECGAAVKADAYGLGMAEIAPHLAKVGCRTFCVALVSEGLALRRLLPDATIYILNGVFDPPAAREAGLIPFISSLDALDAWPDDLPFVLNIDTGMNRLGVALPDALQVTRRPVMIASHFACADTPHHPLNALQESAFRAARSAFKDVPASFANSAALLTRPQSHYDLVRPGIALYGGTASPDLAPLEVAVRLEARIVQVREVETGDSVGYGAAERVRRASRIAIASLGYADGYLRAAGGTNETNGAPVFVNGHITRLVGRVSMDLVALDVTDIAAKRGDYVEFIGRNVPLETVAQKDGTIGYELLTDLSRRAVRRYGPL